MRERSSLRYIVYLAYLGMVFIFGGLVYERLTRFDGYIYMGENRFERVVVQPVGEGGIFFGSHRNMPIDVVPFSDPRNATRVFKDDTLYHAQLLPFTLRLNKIDLIQAFPDRHVLEVSEAGTTTTHELHVGAPLDIAGKAVEVAALRPWAGLLRNPKGAPMAAVSLRDPKSGWSREFLLSRDVWTFPGPDTFFLLRWHDSEEAARADAATLPKTLAAGRWGVRDGQRVHWSTSLLPGGGFTLDDGTEVTLIAHDPASPEITVEFRKGDATEVVKQRANQSKPERVHFEAPTRAQIAWVLYAWRDAAALVQRLEGDVLESRELREGEFWEASDGGGAMRLDQVMAGALPVTPASNEGRPVTEAVLHGEGVALQLREGLYINEGEVRLRYRREAVPARVRYALTAQNREGEVGSIVLAPGDTQRIGAWLFSQDARFPRTQEGALLHARRTLGAPSQWVGMAMVIVGAFGWVILRFRPHHARPMPPRTRPPADAPDKSS
jgi:hypothetical protein